jgi:predicted DNA-binding transcriptional regulator AlpA
MSVGDASKHVVRAVERALRERFATSTPTTDAEWRDDAEEVARAAIKAHTEPHVTYAELSALMGLSVPTLKRMVNEGMPSETWGRRARRFLPSECREWARLRDSD